MITKDIFNSITGVATVLANRSTVLSAVPNTVLSELVRLSVPVLDVNAVTQAGEIPTVDDNSQLTEYGYSIELTTSGSLEAPSSHDLEMDGYIRDISKLVNVHISNAKNVVAPEVTELAELIMQYQQSQNSGDPTRKFNIVVLNIPRILEDGFFLDSFASFKGKTVLSPAKQLQLPTKTAQELQEMVLSGDRKTDEKIAEWLAGLESDFLTRVWNNLFTTAPMITDPMSVTDDSSARILGFSDVNFNSNNFDKANIGLAILLLARRLSNGVMDDNIAMSLTEYKQLVGQYELWAGTLLATTVSKLSDSIKSNILVLESIPEKMTIKVNGVIYRQWLEQGGSVEILLGLLVSTKKVYSADLINQEKDNYLKQWNSYYMFSKTDDANKSFFRFKEFLGSTFVSTLRDLTEFEVNYRTANTNADNMIIDLAAQEIASLKTGDMDSPYDVALRLVGKCRFFYTSAYSILSDIASAGEANENANVREAALLAAINYIADYLSAQIAVVR